MYKKLIDTMTNQEANCIKRLADGAVIPKDPANTDYQEYLQFLADGGVVAPADTPEEAE